MAIYQWGVYVLGPFPKALIQQFSLIVGVDYFMKWIESESQQKGFSTSTNSISYVGSVYKELSSQIHNFPAPLLSIFIVSVVHL